MPLTLDQVVSVELEDLQLATWMAVVFASS